MKRRIVRIAAGSVIILAWLAAGVYAFWGSKSDGGGTPVVDPDAMSQQIAAANVNKPQPGVVTPAVAVEDAPLDRPPAAAHPLFNRTATTSAGAFKPRPGAFQPPPTEVPEAAPMEVYENSTPPISVPLGGSRYQPSEYDSGDVEPTPDLNPSSEDVYADASAEDDAYGEAAGGGAPPMFQSNPLRSAARTLGNAAAGSFDGEEEGNLQPLGPPPARFGDSVPAGEPRVAVPTPAPQRETGFSNPPYGAPPANSLPAAVGESPYGTPREMESSRFSPSPESRSALGNSALRSDAGSSGSLASDRPGQQALEGAQAPAVVIEKVAPAEIQVGKPAKFEVHVRNAGQSAAQNVVVTDHVPAGTRLIDSKPQALQSADGALLWQLGTLEPGATKSIAIEVMPEKEGEIGSVAQVMFAAVASVKTVSTRPQLTVEQTAPAKVMIGETVTVQITIANPGTGVATNVVLQEDVPEGLSHSAGKELEYEVGTLRPGETRKLELQLQAAKAGVVQNTLVVRGDANLSVTHSATIEVLAPQLAVAMSGPKRRYLDRQATYTVSIANPGTAAARDVEIVAYLPKGMKFVSTDREGQYDAQNHAVYWSLEELPAAQQGSATLVTIPIETGEQKLRVEGHAQLNLNSSDEGVVLVEAIPQLVFEIIDEADPIEVGADTIYQVRVVNEGSKAATNVQVAAALPPELRPVGADGATRGGIEGQTVVFEPLGKLAPQAEAVFKIQATGLRTGDYTIRVQLTSDDLQTPVTKEEPTRVYADR